MKKTWIIHSLMLISVMIIGLCMGIIFGKYQPNNKLQAQLDLGNKYLSELDYENAKIAFGKALKIDEKCTEAYLGLASVWVGLGEIESAVEILETGISITNNKTLGLLQKKLDDAKRQIEISEADTEQGLSEEGLPLYTIDISWDANQLSNPDLTEIQFGYDNTIEFYSNEEGYYEGINSEGEKIISYEESPLGHANILIWSDKERLNIYWGPDIEDWGNLAECTATIYSGDQVLRTVTEETGWYRSYTGYVFLGICSLYNGELGYYDASWIDAGWESFEEQYG